MGEAPQGVAKTRAYQPLNIVPPEAACPVLAMRIIYLGSNLAAICHKHYKRIYYPRVRSTVFMLSTLCYCIVVGAHVASWHAACQLQRSAS